MSKKCQIYRRRIVDGINVKTDVAVSEGLEFHGEWLEHGYTTVTVKSPTPVSFMLGDFIEYRGKSYYLWNEESIKKQARLYSHGEGFVYEHLKFYDGSVMLEQPMMLDYVLNWSSPSNENTYSNRSKFFFVGGSVEDLCDRIQANLNRVQFSGSGLAGLRIGANNPGTIFNVISPNWLRCKQRGVTRADWEKYFGGGGYGTWDSANTEVTMGKTDVEVECDNLTLYGAVGLCYSLFELSFYVNGGDIVVGAPAQSAGQIFRYGKDNGLSVIERNTDESQKIVTRLYATGSEDNLPRNYYANLCREMQCYTQMFNVGATPLHVGLTTKWSEVENAFYMESKVYLPDDPEQEHHGEYTTYIYPQRTGAVVTVESPSYNGTANVFVCYDTILHDWYVAYQYNDDTVVEMLTIKQGANINKWPKAHIVHTGDYPSLLSDVNLMLPGFPKQSLKDWVTSKASGDEFWQNVLVNYDLSEDRLNPWIGSKKADIYGLREGTVCFDGSDDEEKIFPTIEGTDYDTIRTGSSITDNGYVNKADKFIITVSGGTGYPEWDLLYKTASKMVISMKTGQCVGHDFEVNGVSKKVDGNTSYYEVRCTRVQDENDRFVPNCDVKVAAGDHFIVSGVEMPDEYIDKAAEKLLRKAIETLDENDHAQRTYVPSIDEIYMARQHDSVQGTENPSLHDTLEAGMLMRFNDEQLGNVESYIDVLTIKEDGNNGIPTYDVTLRDEKEKTLRQSLSSEIKSVTSSHAAMAGGGNASVSEDDVREIGDAAYLQKTVEDVAEEQIGFLKGLWVQAKELFGIAESGAAKVLNLLVNGTWGIAEDGTTTLGDTTAESVTAAEVIAQLLKTPDFREAVGMIGNGFGVKIDQNGKATLQTDDLLVLGQMIVNSLNIREVTYIGGVYLLTPAGSTVENVLPLYTTGDTSDTRRWTTDGSGTVVGYRLMWKADDGTTGTMNYWKVGDQAYCHTFNLTEAGNYENVRNHHWWRLVCRVGSENGYHYADVANVEFVGLWDGDERLENETGSQTFIGYENNHGTVPEVGDKAVSLGSQLESNRRGAVQITAEGTASIGIYDGINGYRTLSDYEVHLFSKEIVRMKSSRFEWSTANNIKVPPTVYRGVWFNGAISSHYNEWDYNESRWLYIGTIDTTEAPGTTPALWQEVSLKGADGENNLSVKIYGKDTFLNGEGTLTLTAHAYDGEEDITDTLLPAAYSWMRESDDANADENWNYMHRSYGNILVISSSEVLRRALFTCEADYDMKKITE